MLNRTGEQGAILNPNSVGVWLREDGCINVSTNKSLFNNDLYIYPPYISFCNDDTSPSYEDSTY